MTRAVLLDSAGRLTEGKEPMLHHHLPSRSGFDLIQKEAKKLLHALQRKDIVAIERYKPFDILGDTSYMRLADAQYVIARRYGFRNWTSMKEKLAECLGRTKSVSDTIPALRKLANFKRALDVDPTNVVAASRYWSALSSFAGNDVRSGGYAIEAFRRCALDSTAGVIAFAKAFRELFEKSGEKPNPKLFDAELLTALRASLPELVDDDAAVVEWVLSFVG